MGKDGKHTLQGLENLLPQLSRQQGWEEKLELHSVFLRWTDLVDSDVSAHCRPLKIVKNVLWIEVENSAWLQQLQFQSVMLLEIMNNSLPKARFEAVRFCIEERAGKSDKTDEPSLYYVQPPAEEIAAFEQQVASISDPDAREALIRFWYLSRACRKK